MQTWKDIREEDPSQTMLDWLSIFYNSLLSTWHSELTWCSQVFGKSGRVLCLLMSQTLNHLEPPFSVCVKEFVRDEAYPLQQLIDLKQVSAFSLGKTSMREIDYVVRMVVLVMVGADDGSDYGGRNGNGDDGDDGDDEGGGVDGVNSCGYSSDNDDDGYDDRN